MQEDVQNNFKSNIIQPPIIQKKYGKIKKPNAIVPTTNNGSPGKVTSVVNVALTKEQQVAEEKRERNILLEMADEKVAHAIEGGNWSLHKFLTIFVAIVGSVVGTLMIFLGLSLTVLLQGRPKNMILVYVGAIFYLPCCYAFTLFLCVFKSEKERRERITKNVKITKKKTLYDDMIRAAAAQKVDENPPSLIRVVGVRPNSKLGPLREIPCLATTLGNFCEHMEEALGIPVVQQCITFKGKELRDLSLHLEVDYKLKRNDKLYIFNKGKYMTAIEEEFKLRRKFETEEDIKQINEGHQEDKDPGPTRPSFFDDVTRRASANGGERMSIRDANRRSVEMDADIRKSSVSSVTSTSTTATTKVAWKEVD